MPYVMKNEQQAIWYNLTDIFSSWKIDRIWSVHHDKNKNFTVKNKNCQRITWKYIRAFFILFWTRPFDPWCNMLQTLPGRKKYEKGMSVEQPHTSNTMTKLRHLYFKIQKSLKTYRNANLGDFRRLFLGII